MKHEFNNQENTSTFIEACLDCMIKCQTCLEQMAVKESSNDCPRCCIECSAICLLCAQSAARNSRFLPDLAKICLEACNWCEDQCSQHSHAHCKECAESCKACAESCEKLLG